MNRIVGRNARGQKWLVFGAVFQRDLSPADRCDATRLPSAIPLPGSAPQNLKAITQKWIAAAGDHAYIRSSRPFPEN